MLRAPLPTVSHHSPGCATFASTKNRARVHRFGTGLVFAVVRASALEVLRASKVLQGIVLGWGLGHEGVGLLGAMSLLRVYSGKPPPPS